MEGVGSFVIVLFVEDEGGVGRGGRGGERVVGDEWEREEGI